MKSYQMQTAIESAKKALAELAYLDAEQIIFVRRLINDGMSELVMQSLEDEREKAEEEKEVPVQ